MPAKTNTFPQFGNITLVGLQAAMGTPRSNSGRDAVMQFLESKLDVESFLESHEDLSAAEQVAILIEELGRRPAPPPFLLVESYFTKFPAIADNSDLQLRLISAEIEVRRRHGDLADWQLYAARFPDLGPKLEQHYQKTIVPIPTHEPSAEDEQDTGAPSFELQQTTVAAPTPTVSGGHCSPGDVFGDYRIEEKIARGGMGVVFRATQLSLNRPVALKMILGAQLASDEEIRRFQTEAESVARLDHPGIVPVHEVGQFEGQHFFSMTLVSGGSLTDLVRPRPLSCTRAAEIVRAIAEAIQYAHRRSIIHRDLKPGNVLLDADGQPKVADFGLAKSIESDVGMTATGAILGTPSYMAPEQASGRSTEVGPPADIYALGGILYFLVTAHPPFQGANPIKTLQQVINNEPVSPRQRNSDVDLDLETIILKCLEKEPAHRFASAQELVDELNRYLQGEPILSRPIRRSELFWRRVRRNPVMSALGAVLAVVVLALAIGGPLVAANQVTLRRAAEDARAAEGIQLARAETLAANLQESLADTETARARAVAEREATERSLYFNQIALADLRWRTNNVAGAEEALDQSAGKFAHWEWHHLMQRLHPERLILDHNAHPSVLRVALSADEATLASLSWDGTLRLWSLPDGSLQGTFPPREEDLEAVDGLTFSPDGKLLLAGLGQQGGIRVWDVAQTMPVSLLSNMKDVVASLAFSPEGERLAIASGRTVTIWDTATWNVETVLEGHETAVNDVAFDSQGLRVVTASSDGTARIWDANKGTQLNAMAGTDRALNCAVFSPDGQQLFTGGYDQAISTWDVNSGKRLTFFHGHVGAVNDLALSTDGEQLVSCGSDRTIRVWDLESGMNLVTFRGHRDRVESVVMAKGRQEIISSAADGTVRVWDATRHPERRSFTAPSEVTCVQTSPDGRLVASGTEGGVITIRKLDNGQQQVRFQAHQDTVSAIDFSRDGKTMVSGSWDQTVKIWETTSWELVTTFAGHEFLVYDVAISSDGQAVVSGSGDRTARVWDIPTASLKFVLSGHPHVVSSVAFSPDGSKIATAGYDQTIKLWHALNGEEIRTLDGRVHGESPTGQPYTFHYGHRSMINCLAFDPQGARLASGSGDRTLKVWDLKNGRVLTTLKGHADDVTQVTFSPDGQRLVSASSDGTIKIWDGQSGLEALTLDGHSGGVASVVVSPDSQWIVSGGNDRNIKIWDGQNAARWRTP